MTKCSIASGARALLCRLRFSIRSARERILRFLQLQAGPDSEYAIQGSLKDLATSLGLAHETFYRELARLESGKLIARRRGSIRLQKTSAV